MNLILTQGVYFYLITHYSEPSADRYGKLKLKLKKKKRYNRKELIRFLDNKVDRDFNGSIAAMGRHFGVSRVHMCNVISLNRGPSPAMVKYALGDNFSKFKEEFYAEDEFACNSA